MNNLNEQILFYNDICVENSYLNEEDSSAALIKYDKNNTTLANNNAGGVAKNAQSSQALQRNANIIKRTRRPGQHQISGRKDGETYISDYGQQDSSVKKTRLGDIAQDAEIIDDDRKNDDSQKLLGEHALNFQFEPKLDITLEVGKYKVIPLDKHIKITSQSLKDFEITQLTFDTKSANVFTCSYLNIPYDYISSIAKMYLESDEEVDENAIKEEIENAIKEYSKSNDQQILFVYGFAPTEDSDIIANFKVSYKTPDLDEVRTESFIEEIGTVSVNDARIISMRFVTPTNTNPQLNIGTSINLLDFLYVKLASDKKNEVRWVDLEDSIKEANKLAWDFSNNAIKNIIKLSEDGVISVSKENAESFKKLLSEEDAENKMLTFSVFTYLQKEPKIGAEIEILALENPSDILDFDIVFSENQKAEIEGSITRYNHSTIAGIEDVFFVKPIPETAKKEYYKFAVSTEGPITIKDLGNNKYSFIVNSDADINALSKNEKQIVVKAFTKKAETTGKGVINGTIVKYIDLDIMEIPKNLRVVWDPSTTLEIALNDNNESKSIDLLRGCKVIDSSNNEIDIINDYNALFKKIMNIKFASSDENVVKIVDNIYATPVNVGEATLYVYLERNNEVSKTIPDGASSRQANVYKVPKYITIDVPPKPASYPVIMAPVVGGKSGAIFGIRHYTLNPEQEIDTTNNRSISLLGSNNPIKFFSNILEEYADISVKNWSNKPKKRLSNSTAPNAEDRIMNNKNVEKQFHNINVSTWKQEPKWYDRKVKESVDTLDDYTSLNEAASKRNVLKPSEDLDKCTLYFKELFELYTTSLNIIYGDETEKFYEYIHNELINQFKHEVFEKRNLVGAYIMSKQKLRAAADALTTKNKNVALYKKLGEDLDSFAENTNKTMIDRIEAAFAGLLSGKVKGGTDSDGSKSKVPLDQAYLKNLWHGYYLKLKRDVAKFQQKFINSEAYIYTRKIHNTVIPDLLSLVLICIAAIIYDDENKQNHILDVTKDNFDWDALFNYSPSRAERDYDVQRTLELKKGQAAQGDVKDLIENFAKAAKHNIEFRKSKFAANNFVNFDKLCNYAKQGEQINIFKNGGVEKDYAINLITPLLVIIGKDKPDVNDMDNIYMKIDWSSVK